MFCSEFFYESSSPKPLIESLQIISQIRGGIHKVFIFHDIYIDHRNVDTGNQNNENNISLLSPQTEGEEKK